MARRLFILVSVLLLLAACSTPAERLRVASIDPRDEATDVAVTSAVTVRFEARLDPATVDGVEVALLDGDTPVDATVEVGSDGSTAVLTPNRELAEGTLFTVHLGDAIATPAGLRLLGGHRSSFTTAPALAGGGAGDGSGSGSGGDAGDGSGAEDPVDPSGGNPDATPLAHRPVATAADEITMTFEGAMDPTTLKSEAFKIEGGTFGTIHDDGYDDETGVHTVRLVLDDDLEPGTHTVILTTHLTDLGGDGYDQDVRWPVVVEDDAS